MATTFGYQQYTVNGKTVHLKWLDASIDDVTIRNVGATTCGNSGYYGINGTFFNPPDGQLLGIAVEDGSSVRYAGDTNYYNRGAMINLITDLGDGTFLFTDKISNFTNYTYNGYSVPITNVEWGIGGISLFLENSSLNESSFYSLVSSENPPSGTIDRPRTAIGYKAGARVILCAIFDGDDLWEGGNGYGCNLWDVRMIMKDKFGCTKAINLDGGGSTQISYKLNGNDCYHQTSSTVIYSMITVPM